MADRNILDLCDMSGDDTRRLNELYTEYKSEYMKMIDRLSRGKNTVYWWATHFSSRNFFLSDAYKNICIAMLGIEKLKVGRGIHTAYCPTDEIAAVIKAAVTGNAGIKVKHKRKKASFKEHAVNYFRHVAAEMARHKRIRKVLEDNPGCGFDKSKGIVLIDTYAKASEIPNGCYEEQYFNNILDYTDREIFFMPQLFLNTKATADRLVKKLIRNSRYRYIFKEQFLKKQDMLKLLPYPLFCAAFCARKKYFKGVDVTPIVNRDLIDSIASGNSVVGMLKYQAVKRMKKEGIEIERLIGWYEGQPSSNCLFMGYRQAYPKGESIGYIGYAADKNDISLAPGEVQARHGASPRRMAVVADCFKDVPKQFVRELEVISAPAFRMQGDIMRGAGEKGKNSDRAILAALPYDVASAIKMLSWIKCIEQYLKDQSIKLHIKNHPCNKGMSLKQYGIKPFECSHSFIDGTFGDAVNGSDIVITIQSTSGYETALYGKPIIFLNFPGGLNINYMPEEWEGTRYDVVYSTDELQGTIRKYINCVLEKPDFADERYHVAASRETVGRLFG